LLQYQACWWRRFTYRWKILEGVVLFWWDCAGDGTTLRRLVCCWMSHVVCHIAIHYSDFQLAISFCVRLWLHCRWYDFGCDYEGGFHPYCWPVSLLARCWWSRNCLQSMRGIFVHPIQEGGFTLLVELGFAFVW
jgi:hypothetical protein